MGVSLPGKFPGELEVSRDQYSQWFQLIKDAGFNTIRLYTLHYPHFYEVLDSFNLANPSNPLFFFQGVWLEEELEGYHGDLYDLTDFFHNEIEENIDCVHGNRIIEPRLGKAHGEYIADVSGWNVGYIIGREIYGQEILQTNNAHPDNDSFTGDHFAIQDAEAAEVWATKALNHVVSYEHTNYGISRPVSFSSWPTLDPLEHPEEPFMWEDAATIDLSTIELINAPGGIFFSYHIYPYYPAFINLNTDYQQYYDEYGINTYLGYVTELKEHYEGFPLIVAEYGVPSSWGAAKYAISGMHHGGFDEWEQGDINIRLLKSIEEANCGGGIQFALLDEWFKKSWIDYVDYLPERRPFWYNPTSPEQNYGLLKFQQQAEWETLGFYGNGLPVQEIEVKHDHGFFYLGLNINEPFITSEGMWIAFDTYDGDLGESVMPTGDTIVNRAEFALHITNTDAKLYVTRAYDIFGFFHNSSFNPGQLYRSIPTDGDPWNFVQWQISTLSPYDIFPIGDLQLNYSVFPPNSHDAVTIGQQRIDIRIPWSLLQFVDPGGLRVLHDYRSTPEIEDTITDGIAVSVFYEDQEFASAGRYVWESWNTVDNYEEIVKGSYYVMKSRMHEFNNRAIAFNDTIEPITDTANELIFTEETGSILANDFDMDGDTLEALLLNPPQHGTVQLSKDGSFIYTLRDTLESIPYDSFGYVIFDGYSLSEPANATIILNYVADPVTNTPSAVVSESSVRVFPNPVSEYFSIDSKGKEIKEITLYDALGKKVLTQTKREGYLRFNVDHLNPGTYFLKINTTKGDIVEVIQKM